MPDGGTAYIDFKGDFTGLLGSSRQMGARAGVRFSDSFGGSAKKSILGSFKSIAKTAGPLLAVAGAGSIFSSMIEEGREAEKVSRVTTNAIKATGGAANVSAEQVGDLAESLSAKAGIDDELIQTGANLLLTFKNVRNEAGKGNDIFNRAAAAAVDLSVQFGSADSTSKMLGKALNDPLKGLTALGKAGVTFSDQQKEQIETFVATGDTLKAQAIILDEVESQVGGAAAAAADPLDRLSVAWGNLLEQGGAKVLPWISDLAEGLAEKLPGAIDTAEAKFDSLVARGQELGRSLWQHVEPAADDVWGALVNVRDILDELRQSGEPIVRGLALIGGAVVIGAIRGAAAALEGITGFLADNEGLIRLAMAALVAFGALKAWAVIWGAIETIYIKWLLLQGSVTSSSILGGLRMISAGFLTMGTDAATGAGMVRGGMSSIAGAVNPVGAVIAGVSIAFMTYASAVADAEREAKAWRQELEEGINPASINDYEAALREATATHDRAKEWLVGVGAGEGEDAERSWKRLGAVVRLAGEDLTWMENTMRRHKEQMEESGDAAQTLSVNIAVLKGMYEGVGDSLGLSAEQVEAAALAFDLNPATMSVEEFAGTLNTRLVDAAEMAGHRGEQIKEAIALSPEELEAQKAQWQELSQAVSGAWVSQLDVVAGLGGQADLTKQKITDWYALQTEQATTFGNNISTALQQGYDPALISRLLQAGPAQAAPLLQAMVSNHADGLVEIVNMAEGELGRLSTLAVEMARIQNMAMQGQTDDMTEHMAEGMRIAEVISRLGAFGTATAIAQELGIGVEEVKRIAELYGLGLATAINPILNAVGADPIVQAAIGARYEGQARAEWARMQAQGRNQGGPIFGPNVDRDVVPAMLTPGEYVHRKSAVDKWGLGAMSSLNQGQAPPGWVIPGFNAGGLVDLPKPPSIGGWPLARGGEGAIGKAYAAAQEYVRTHAPMDSYGSGGSAASARGWIMQALGILGLPAGQWLEGLMKRAHQESGWNPRAINLWDSNAKKGVPSKGFLQTIDPTFSAYKLPGYNDIWNPVHNTIAAIRYMQARYGGVWNLPRGGYNEGGEVVFQHKRNFDSGGVLEKGWNLVRNQTGGREALRPSGGDTHVTLLLGENDFHAAIDGRIEDHDGEMFRLVRVGEERHG